MLFWTWSPQWRTPSHNGPGISRYAQLSPGQLRPGARLQGPFVARVPRRAVGDDNCTSRELKSGHLAIDYETWPNSGTSEAGPDSPASRPYAPRFRSER